MIRGLVLFLSIGSLPGHGNTAPVRHHLRPVRNGTCKVVKCLRISPNQHGELSSDQIRVGKPTNYQGHGDPR